MPRLPIAILLCLPLLADAADTYRVGVAQIDITPSHPIRLNGFGFRRAESEGVYQRIWAKALAIEDESKEPAVLMTVDVLGIPDHIRAEVARRLEKKTGLKPDRLAITATHTHTGPMLKGANQTLFGVPIPKEHLANIDRYTAEFLDKMEQVGVEALAKRAPAKLSYAIGKATFAKNRRRAGGPVDHDLPVLFVHDPDGKTLRAVYTSYACHCVTLSFNKVGGDWAGFAMEEIQSALPNAVALVSVGCGADSNPSSGVTGDKVETARLQGREIATEVKRLAGNFRAPVTGKLTTQWKQIELPLAPHPTRAQWEEKARRKDAVGHHARVQLERLDRKEALPAKVDYPIQTWAFGDTMAMAFLPGEVVVDYALRLKKELDGQRLWVTAYTNTNPCYIPSERVLKEGGYEGGGAMIYYDLPGPFQPGLEEPIIRVVKDQLGKTFPPKFDAGKTGGSMPLSPQQSLAAIKTKPDMVVELVAAEPLVDSPVAIAFGPDGKLWVCEMIDYPEGKTGMYEPGGRVRYLEDRNGDGRMDEATTFLDGIPFPTGVTVWRKGVLVCAAPDILYAEDTDGDGKADVKKVLFTGFGTGNYQARVNSLTYGLDGWVYGACGLAGGTIKSFNGNTYPLGNRDFRIKPDTGELEPVTGLTQQGRARDDWGNWFGCDNSTLIRHYPLDDHYLKRNPHVTYPSTSVFVPAGPNPTRLYPLKADQQRFQLSGPPNTVTAACGLCIYRDDLLGDDYRGNAFVCEPVNLLVHRLKLTPKGSTFVGHRAADEQDREFLASTDNWFRPVQATTGPDGCLWVVDMYRLVIEHPRWIPPQDLEKLDLRAGAGMGRIYRVRPRNSLAPAPERLDNLSRRELFGFLNNPNGWQRDMAMQMLEWTPQPTPIPISEWLAKNRQLPETRVGAMASLNAIELLPPAMIGQSISDPSPGVRRWAIRFAERLLQRDGKIGAAVVARADDEDAQVRLQVAYSLGHWDAPKAAEALGRMAVKHADDPYLVAAVLSSVNGKNLPGVLTTVLKESGDKGPPAALINQLGQIASATGNREPQRRLVAAALVPKNGKYARWQFVAVAGFYDRQDPAVAVRRLEQSVNAILDMKAAAVATVLDDRASEADRLAALLVVGIGPPIHGTEIRALGQLLTPTTSPNVRAAAVAHIGRLPGKKADELLVAGWKEYLPATRAQVLDILVGREDGPNRLLGAIESKKISPGELDATRRQRLLTHADPAIRERAAKVFGSVASPDRAKVLQAYAGLPATGDPTRGKAVFGRICAACHRLGDVGHAVGPDLAALANRTPAYLLQEILDPNRNLDSRYVEYQAVTAAGRTVTGLLAGETSTTVILRGQEGKEETLLRADIEELRGSGKSLMPEGLEKDLPKTDMADLLAYVTAVRPPPKVFPGNAPKLVKAAGRRFVLRATDAEIYGGDIAFEQEFKNVGLWHGPNDRAEWRIEVPSFGTYDIFLDFACDPGSAGNELVIEGADPAVRWKVPSTGGWSKYQTARAGIVRMPAGERRITIRPAGPLRGALVDLRTVYLLPPGQTPKADPARKDMRDPTGAAEVAKLILDDAQPRDRRERLVANNLHQAAAVIKAMAAGIPDQKEEYRRIPWIWRVAVAAGRKNDTDQLKAILDASLPGEGGPLRHWQAVVIGGGVINGVSQAGAWPGRRMAEILAEARDLNARWAGSLKLAFPMADDEKVPTGTRYDALRMIALADWKAAESALTKYLKKDAHPELQMGAVSGLDDVEHPKAAELLLNGLADFAPNNRKLAVAGLLRTPERAKVLLDALAAGRAKAEWLTPDHRKRLLENPDEGVRTRARDVLRK